MFIYLQSILRTSTCFLHRVLLISVHFFSYVLFACSTKPFKRGYVWTRAFVWWVCFVKRPKGRSVLHLGTFVLARLLFSHMFQSIITKWNKQTNKQTSKQANKQYVLSFLTQLLTVVFDVNELCWNASARSDTFWHIPIHPGTSPNTLVNKTAICQVSWQTFIITERPWGRLHAFMSILFTRQIMWGRPFGR